VKVQVLNMTRNGPARFQPRLQANSAGSVDPVPATYKINDRVKGTGGEPWRITARWWNWWKASKVDSRLGDDCG
jgi:hypothetical protein